MTYPLVLEPAADVLKIKSIRAVRAVREELSRVLASPEFKAPARLRAFLRFVVDETVSGNGDNLKGYTIATRVFGRAEDFDPVKDPIVRIEAGRLRKALERYYLLSGKNDSVRIDIPLGTYVPVFYRQNGEGSGGGAKEARPEEAVLGQAVCTIVTIMQLSSRSQDLVCECFAVGLTEEIVVALSRFRNLQIITALPSNSYDLEAVNGTCGDANAPFILSGTVWKEGDSIRVIVHLHETASGTHLWGECYDVALDGRGMFASEREIAEKIAGAVGGKNGVTARRPPRCFKANDVHAGT